MRLHREKLTKSYILNRITQENIIEYYLNIKVDVSKSICCPPELGAPDSNPSFGFYYSDYGRLRGRDLRGGFHGDCFDIVGEVIGANTRTPQGFQLALNDVAMNFRLHKYEDVREVINYNRNIGSYLKAKKAKRVMKRYYITFRHWDSTSLKYWKRFNINVDLLNYAKIYPAYDIYRVTPDNKTQLIYTFKYRDPAFCYYGGKRNGIDLWKIYFPFRSKSDKKNPRFLSNAAFLQGKHLIKGGRVGGILKAYKDVVSLYSFGIQSVAPGAESVMLSQKEYHFMRSNFDFLFSCMDYDTTGIRMMKKLWKAYRIQPYMFTDGSNGSNNFEVKDFAEYVDKKGIDETLNLLRYLYNKHELDFQMFDTTLFNKFKIYL